MHNAVKSFIREVRKETRSKYWVRSYFRCKDVLEVGSQNVNGSPRKYFWFCNYTGIDICEGNGVDVVLDITRHDIDDFIWFTQHKLSYDVVISTEMLEHCEKWDLALKNMFTLLSPNGLLLITCAAPGRYEHGTNRTTPEDSPATTDYYRNISIEDFESILPRSLFIVYVLQYARGNNDLQFYGIKKPKRTLAFGTSYDPI